MGRRPGLKKAPYVSSKPENTVTLEFAYNLINAFMEDVEILKKKIDKKDEEILRLNKTIAELNKPK